MSQFTIEEIRRAVDGRLTGDPTVVITGVEEINAAGPGDLTIVGSKKFVRLWDESKAAGALVTEGLDIEPGPGRALVHVADADLAMARALGMFAPEPPRCGPGIHATAVVDPSATLGADVSIGAGCYVGPGAVIGEGSLLYPNVTVMDDSVIGPGSVIWPGTVVRERCRIGRNCILHPNVTIGADGFGYRPAPDGRGLVKIPQIGTVEIGDDVEIGAGSCVDRGKFSTTTVGDGTKIDNQIQIAHNCRIGRSCVMAGQSGLAGSVTLGDGVMVGGGVRVKDHTTIGSGARLGGGSIVIGDVEPGETVLGYPAGDARGALRQWAALKQLPALIMRIKKLPE